jgi:hypothetical protein
MSSAPHDRATSGLTWCLRLALAGTLVGLSWSRFVRLDGPAPTLDTLAIPLWLLALGLLPLATPVWPDRRPPGLLRTASGLWFRSLLFAGFALLLTDSLVQAVSISGVAGRLLPLQHALRWLAPLLLFFLISLAPPRRAPDLRVYWRALRIAVVISFLALGCRGLIAERGLVQPSGIGADGQPLSPVVRDEWLHAGLPAIAVVLAPLILLLRSRLIPICLSCVAAANVLLQANSGDAGHLAAQMLSHAAAIVIPLSLLWDSSGGSRNLSSSPASATRWNSIACLARCALTAAVLTAMAGVGLRMFDLQGMLRPVRTSSGSMAPTLLGPHYQATCRQCEFPFAFDAVVFADLEWTAGERTLGERIVCPNCGYRHEQFFSSDWPRRLGERVLVDRAGYRHSPPQRWDLVAIRAAYDPHLEAKRLIGLPGETVSIERGRIRIDGRPARKSLSQLRQMAVPVHDSAYQPPAALGLPQRWRTSSTKTTRSLVYHHWRCFDSPLPRTEETPLLDNDAYNQHLSRTLHPVADVLLTADLTIRQRGQLSFHYLGPTHAFELRVELSAWTAQFLDERRTPIGESRPLCRASWPSQARWEFAVIEDRVLLALDRQLLLDWPLPDDRRLAARPGNPRPPPLAISWRGLEVQAERLQIARDLYYLHPHQRTAAWTMPEPLAENEYFVLGDNSPVSIDSRHQAAVSASRIVGRVVRWR